MAAALAVYAIFGAVVSPVRVSPPAPKGVSTAYG